MKLHYANLTDAPTLGRCIDTISRPARRGGHGRPHVPVTGLGHIRYCQAGSSEMFGTRSRASGSWAMSGQNPLPLSETSPFLYAVSQCTAYRYTINYREARGLFACNAILFNHDSPRQGKVGLRRELVAMWLMLQHERPDGYVVATGESHTVEDFLDEALEYAGLDWEHHAKKVLGWKPKVGFKELVRMMVDEDIELAKREKALADAGGYMDAQQQS
ncbi:hypothetical protein ACJRO7_005406 [Eucalyptus globulus]|uniref:GDP-mannose 4,6-dehydratase n=1 Tax=Eucalyptus globulus TaxID=34317 RepID=A0ABD3J1M3_EUCGL